MVVEDLVTEAFTELAPHYREVLDRELRQFWGLGYAEFIDRLIEVSPLNDGDLVLDVATGTAQIPLAMARAGARNRIVGLDITPAMLNYGLANLEAEGLTSSTSLVCASAMAMPFTGSSLDLVLCGLAMHHMDVYQALSEIRRVLKEGGHLALACVSAPPFWRSRWGSALVRTIAWFYGLTHRSARGRAEVAAVPNVHTADEWRHILSQSGFAEIEISAQIGARHFWCPDGLILRAIKNDSFSPSPRGFDKETGQE